MSVNGLIVLMVHEVQTADSEHQCFKDQKRKSAKVIGPRIRKMEGLKEIKWSLQLTESGRPKKLEVDGPEIIAQRKGSIKSG